MRSSSSSRLLCLLVVLFALVVVVVVSATRNNEPTEEEIIQDSRNTIAQRRREGRELQQQRERQQQQQAGQSDQERQQQEEEDNSDIQIPELVGRARHGWSHQQRELKESREVEKKADIASVHPLMKDMSTEKRAALMLFAKIESRFQSANSQTRQLLRMLTDANPHHTISAKYERLDQEELEKQRKGSNDVVHYEKVQAMDGAISRLEYKLQDTKTLAEEVAREAAGAREENKRLATEQEEALEKQKKDCDNSAQNQEGRIAEIERELSGKNSEVVELQKSLDSVTQSSSGTGFSNQWKMMIIRHTDLFLIGFGVSVPVLLVLGFLCGRRSGGGSPRSAGAASRSGGDSKKNDDLFGNNNQGPSSGFQQQQQQQYQQQQQTALSPNSELKNRTLQKFDGSV